MPPAARRRRLGIGIVGLKFGAEIIRQLRTGPGGEDFEVVAVCDRDAARTAEVAAATNASGYAEIEAMLDDPRVEVVGVFTPPVGRAAVVERVIRAGRDVMTTKPFERDPRAARDVLELAAGLGRVVHLNSPAPVLPADLVQIECWRDEHDLGRPVGARAETWASYHEQPDGGWYDDPRDCPVAPVYRLGIYLLNDLVRLLGPAAEVRVLDSRIRTGRPTADNGVLAVRFENDALATIYASFCIGDGQSYTNSLAVHYEHGSVYRETPGGAPEGPVASALRLVRRGPDGHAVVEEETVVGGSGRYDWSAFRAAVDGDAGSTQVGRAQIVAGIEIVEAMWVAVDTGAATITR